MTYDHDVEKMLENNDISLMAETLHQCRLQWMEDIKKHNDKSQLEIIDLKRIIKNFQEITNVLGTGIGHIAPPDGFFELWNGTEIKAEKLQPKEINHES